MAIKGFERGVYILVNRQEYPPAGTEPFQLVAYRDPVLFLQKDFRIYTSSNGNTALKHEKDYVFFTNDVLYTNGDFVGQTVSSYIQIVNPTFQNIPLFITYYWVADYASAEMFNRFDRGLDQMINSIVVDESGNVVVSNAGNVVAQGERYPGYRQEL